MITLSPAPELPALNHPWSLCFGQGRAAELLRNDCLAHLAKAKATLGFRYLRFHGLFHDALNIVTRRSDGSLCFQWAMIDRAFDALLEMGIRPFVELNAMPLALASGTQTIFAWNLNVTPPRQMGEWGQLVEAFTRHCVTRWGLPEVRQWYFEVWNEPNLSGFWSGTREEYFELYRQSALAVKSVDPSLRIGGPATAQARWIPELIAYCVQHQVPIDFVSTHSYQQDELCFYPGRTGSPHAPGEYLLDQFKRVREEVSASPRPDLEIHWTEWNSLSASPEGKVSWTESTSTDELYAGSFVLRLCAAADRLCDSMSWWIISDVFGEHGISPLPFSHAYGLLTVHGIPKPTYHVFKWLSRMTGPRYAVSGTDENPARGLLAVQDPGGALRILIWLHPPRENAADEWQDTLHLNLPQACLLSKASLRQGCGSAYEAWMSWGAPPNLTPSQQELLEACSTPESEGLLLPAGPYTLPFRLAPYEVIYLEFAPAERSSEKRGIFKEKTPASLEARLAEKTTA